MRFTLLAIILSVASCGAASCAKPVGRPTPHTISLSDAELVCYHLLTLGCPQGDGCAVALHNHQGRTADFHPDCLLSANSNLQAEQCGSVRCHP